MRREPELEAKDVDIRDVKKCQGCDGPLRADGSLNAYRITVDSLIVDPGAVRQFAGLGLMLGSPGLADVFAPDRALLKCFGSDAALICFRCYCDLPMAHLLERIGERKRDEIGAEGRR